MDSYECDVCGWELNNPDPDLFDLEVVEIFGSCVECIHSAECGLPCESMRRLAPKEGRLVGLGHQRDPDESAMSYFALLVRGEVKFIKLSSPKSYWATVSCISHENVPKWALSRLDLENELSA